jgi:hypothetical protein
LFHGATLFLPQISVEFTFDFEPTSNAAEQRRKTDFNPRIFAKEKPAEIRAIRG